MIAAIALVSMLSAAADETGGDGDAATPAKQAEESPVAPPAPHAYPARVYNNVDDVGLIIGGASEDAKAKVGRLPVRD